MDTETDPRLIEPHSDPIIAGQQLSWWLKNYDLPLHIYYAPIIRRNLRAFQRVFAENYPKGQVCFAAKACTHEPILALAREEGCGADVASYNEVRCALEAGIPASRLDLNGNCKEDFLIEQAIHEGMSIIADCPEEIELIDGIAARLGRQARVLLRLSGYDLGEVTADTVFTSGRWTKFGTPLEFVPNFLTSLRRFPYVRLAGFHTHIGSQVADVQPYIAVLGKMIELGEILRSATGCCDVINIGGGFPVRYVDRTMWDKVTQRIHDGFVASLAGDFSQSFVWHDGPAGFGDIHALKQHLEYWSGERFYTEYPKEQMLAKLLQSDVRVGSQRLQAIEALHKLGDPTLTIEPGRSIMEDSGLTLARVGFSKTVAGHHNLISLEMGVTSHGESLIENPVKRWEIANDYLRRDPEPFETFVAGNLCFSGDMISKYKIMLQRRPRRGDIVIIHDTGAYTSSLLSSASNSYPRPARVLVDGAGTMRILKRRDKYEDIVR